MITYPTRQDAIIARLTQVQTDITAMGILADSGNTHAIMCLDMVLGAVRALAAMADCLQIDCQVLGQQPVPLPAPAPGGSA